MIESELTTQQTPQQELERFQKQLGGLIMTPAKPARKFI
jgi:hypothetical protein